MNLKQEMITILAKLEDATGFDLCIAGGAVRDMLHDRMPKDLDIEILNFSGEHNNDYITENAIESITDALHRLGATEIKVFNEYEGASLDAHVDFVIKCRVFNFYIDIILRNTHPSSVEELVELYDMNLNQVALFKGKVFICKPIVGDVIEPTGKTICLARLQRMQKKYPEYNFSKMIPFIQEEGTN